jgi:DNA-binding CsgD family transcriptional regulator
MAQRIAYAQSDLQETECALRERVEGTRREYEAALAEARKVQAEASSNGDGMAGLRLKLEAKLQALQAVLADGPKGSGAADQSAPKPAAKLNGSKPANRGVAVEKLTRRELEVLRHIAEGKSTKQVAATLGITFKTAACHRYRVWTS